MNSDPSPPTRSDIHLLTRLIPLRRGTNVSLRLLAGALAQYEQDDSTISDLQQSMFAANASTRENVSSSWVQLHINDNALELGLT